MNDQIHKRTILNQATLNNLEESWKAFGPLPQRDGRGSITLLGVCEKCRLQTCRLAVLLA